MLSRDFWQQQIECKYCGGEGLVAEPMSYSDRMKIVCPVCDGEGFVLLEEEQLLKL